METHHLHHAQGTEHRSHKLDVARFIVVIVIFVPKCSCITERICLTLPEYLKFVVALQRIVVELIHFPQYVTILIDS